MRQKESELNLHEVSRFLPISQTPGGEGNGKLPHEVKSQEKNMRQNQFFKRCSPGGDSLGPLGEQKTTEEEERPAGTEGSRKRAYDRTTLKPFGGVGPEEPKGEAGMDLRMRKGESKAG